MAAFDRPSPPLPMLSISAVIAAKTLLNPFDHASLNEPTISGNMQYFPKLGMLNIQVLVDGSISCVALEIDFYCLAKGYKPYFACPICSKRCNSIVFDSKPMCCDCYLENGKAFSKKQRGALLRETRRYMSGGSRASESRWVDRDRYRAGERFKDRYQPAVDAHPRFDSDVEQAPKPLPAADAFSTERAIELGRGANQYEAFFKYEEHGDSIVEALRRHPPTLTRPAKSQPIKDTPVLELNALRRDDGRWPHSRDNALRAYTLKWPNDEPLVIIDGQGNGPLIMVAHRWSHLSEPGWQLLELEVQENGRVRFICPVDGRRYDRLYLRDGHFASRGSQNLSYASQRGAARSRARKRATQTRGAKMDKRNGLLAQLTPRN